MRRLLASLVVLTIGLASAPVLAAPFLSVSPTSGAPGVVVEVTGSGFTAGGTCTLYLTSAGGPPPGPGSSEVAICTVDGNGSLRGSFTVALATASGGYDIWACNANGGAPCDAGSTEAVAARFTVASPNSTTTSPNSTASSSSTTSTATTPPPNPTTLTVTTRSVGTSGPPSTVTPVFTPKAGPVSAADPINPAFSVLLPVLDVPTTVDAPSPRLEPLPGEEVVDLSGLANLMMPVAGLLALGLVTQKVGRRRSRRVRYGWIRKPSNLS
jgi:hypothetical protein